MFKELVKGIVLLMIILLVGFGFILRAAFKDPIPEFNTPEEQVKYYIQYVNAVHGAIKQCIPILDESDKRNASIFVEDSIHFGSEYGYSVGIGSTDFLPDTHCNKVPFRIIEASELINRIKEYHET